MDDGVQFLQQFRFGEDAACHIGGVIGRTKVKGERRKDEGFGTEEAGDGGLQLRVGVDEPFGFFVAVIHGIPAGCESPCDGGFAASYSACETYDHIIIQNLKFKIRPASPDRPFH